MNNLWLNFRELTYSISKSARPLNACSSKHIIWLLSSCKLRRDCAPLKTLRGIAEISLCDRSLRFCVYYKRERGKKCYLVQAHKLSKSVNIGGRFFCSPVISNILTRICHLIGKRILFRFRIKNSHFTRQISAWTLFYIF